MKYLLIPLLSFILFAGCNIAGSSEPGDPEQSEVSILVTNIVSNSQIQAQVEEVYDGYPLSEGGKLYIFDADNHTFELDSTYRVIIELSDHWYLKSVVD